MSSVFFDYQFTLELNFVDLPAGTIVLAASGHGASNWTRTARVDTRTPDDAEKSYFLKVSNLCYS